MSEIIIEANTTYIKEPDFTTKINKALALLKSKDATNYATITTYIGKIRASNKSGANFNETIMTIDIAETTFNASLCWLASVLVHEAIHIQKYKVSGKKYGGAYTMTDKKLALKTMIDEELECNKIQLIALGKIGGTAYEATYLKGLKGDHFDVDKDGDYDIHDYEARSY
jgi:hypothetical protein